MKQYRVPHHPQPLGIRMLQGAGLAFALIILFLALVIFTSDGEIPPGIWLVVPITSVTIAGAGGGVFFYLMDTLREKGSWQKILANIICGITYLPGLYISLIVALKFIGMWS